MNILAMSCCCTDVYPERNVIAAGGNALNLGANCAKTKQANVYLMGNIGTDEYAQVIKATVDQYGINRDRLYEVEGESAHHIVHISNEGDRYFKENSWGNGVYGDYRITKEDEVFMQGMNGVATNCNDPNFKEIIEISRRSKFILAADFNDYKPNDEWTQYFDAIDLFFISANEEDLSKIREWSKLYPKTLFIATLGAKGSIAYKWGAAYICEAEKVKKVVDTTGCGDSYQGAFLVYYLQTGDIRRAMKEGSKAAAVTLSFVGALA